MGSLAAAGLAVGGAQTIRSAAMRLLCLAMHCTGGSELSAERIGRGVERKQLVTHRWTVRQNTSMCLSGLPEGAKRSAPYSIIGAMREVANLWHRWGEKPDPGGDRRLIEAKAPLARASLLAKWQLVLRLGESQ